MNSEVPRRASASPRSVTPAKRTTSLPPARLDVSTVSGPTSGGSVERTAPGAKRSAGTSVQGWTNVSPRMPRGGPTRPTAIRSPSCSATDRLSATVDVDHVDADALAADAGHDLAQRLGRAAVATDHPAEVLRVHADLEPLPAPVVDHVHPDVVRVVHDPAHEVLEGFLEHLSPRRGCARAGRRLCGGRLSARCLSSRCLSSGCLS